MRRGRAGQRTGGVHIPDMPDRVRTAEHRLAAATQQVAHHTEALAHTRAAISLLTQQIAERNTRRPRLQQVQTHLRHGEAEQAEWALLAQLCGRDKLQALELDAAAPAISQYCNLLLGQCFGGRFALTFRTLDAQGARCSIWWSGTAAVGKNGNCD